MRRFFLILGLLLVLSAALIYFEPTQKWEKIELQLETHYGPGPEWPYDTAQYWGSQVEAVPIESSIICVNQATQSSEVCPSSIFSIYYDFRFIKEAEAYFGEGMSLTLPSGERYHIDGSASPLIKACIYRRLMHGVG